MFLFIKLSASWIIITLIFATKFDVTFQLGFRTKKATSA